MIRLKWAFVFIIKEKPPPGGEWLYLILLKKYLLPVSDVDDDDNADNDGNGIFEFHNFLWLYCKASGKDGFMLWELQIFIWFCWFFQTRDFRFLKKYSSYFGVKFGENKKELN